MSVEWDEMHFDVRLLQRVPYEGVSRMQTSLRRRHRERVVRRGIGMVSWLSSTRRPRAPARALAHACLRRAADDRVGLLLDRRRPRALQGPAPVDPLLVSAACPPVVLCHPPSTNTWFSLRSVQETCNFDVLYSYLTCTNCAPHAVARVRHPTLCSPRRPLRVRRRLPLYASHLLLWLPRPLPDVSNLTPLPSSHGLQTTSRRGTLPLDSRRNVPVPSCHPLTRRAPSPQAPLEAQRAHGDGPRRGDVRHRAEGGPRPGQVHRDGQGAHGAVPGFAQRTPFTQTRATLPIRMSWWSLYIATRSSADGGTPFQDFGQHSLPISCKVASSGISIRFLLF